MEVKKLPSQNSLRLPAAIQRVVLSWLALTDLEPLLTLSKEFKAVVTDFVGLLAHFDIGDINVCTCHKSRDLPMAPGAGQGVCRALSLLRHCSNLQTLVLSDCIAGSADRLVALLPTVVARNSATLRQLRSCAQTYSFPLLLEMAKCPRLTHFTEQQPDDYAKHTPEEYGSLVTGLARACPSLTALDVAQFFIVEEDGEHDEIRLCLPEKALVDMLSMGHNLSELTCDYTLPQLAGLLPRFPSLTTLQLRADNLSSGEWSQFEAGMTAVLPKLSRLLSFKIRLPTIDRDAVVSWCMPDSLTSLRVLGDCSHLRLESPGGSLRVLETELDNGAGVWALLAANPNLTELSADSLDREVKGLGQADLLLKQTGLTSLTASGGLSKSVVRGIAALSRLRKLSVLLSNQQLTADLMRALPGLISLTVERNRATKATDAGAGGDSKRAGSASLRMDKLLELDLEYADESLCRLDAPALRRLRLNGTQLLSVDALSAWLLDRCASLRHVVLEDMTYDDAGLLAVVTSLPRSLQTLYLVACKRLSLAVLKPLAKALPRTLYHIALRQCFAKSKTNKSTAATAQLLAEFAAAVPSLTTADFGALLYDHLMKLKPFAAGGERRVELYG